MAYLGSTILLSLLLGIASALLAIGRVFSSPIRNGPWLCDPLVGAQAANPYLRATIAKVGLLALNQSEAIYWFAKEDSDGNPLNGNETYRIEGRDFAARWWSVTAYGSDFFLIPNALERYSYNSQNLGWQTDGSYRVYASSVRQRGNWIPVKRNKNFELTLRLYNPEPSLLENLETIALPNIIRESTYCV